MTFILVDKSKFRSFEGTIKQLNADLKRINHDFESIGRHLDWDVRSYAGINRTIASISCDLENQALMLNKMADFLIYALQQYQKLDQEQFLEVNKFINGTTITPKNQGIVNDTLKWFGIGLKSFEKLEYVGSLSNFFGSTLIAVSGLMINGVFDYAGRSLLGNIVSVIKDGKSAWEDAFNITDLSGETNAKKLVGIATKPKQIPLASWQDRVKVTFGNKINEYFESFTEGGAKSAFSIAGIALSGISNAVENFYEEQDNGHNLNFDRALKETITETVIDVGKDLLIGAGIAAGIAAIGVVGAPAILAGFALNVGSNYALDKISGGDFTEKVSDTLLNADEYIHQKAAEAEAIIGENLNGLVNCFSNPKSIPTISWNSIPSLI